MPNNEYDSKQIQREIDVCGYTSLKGAFSPSLIEKMKEDIWDTHDEASDIGTRVPRGPDRFYCEIHPERLRCFLDLIRHPWLVSVCHAVLGPDYQFVEFGHDIPGPGAKDQKWHRDHPIPEDRDDVHWLAFNITAVNCTRDTAPLMIAPGTHRDRWEGDPLFPPEEVYSRYEGLSETKCPRIGDIMARSPLVVHRGSAMNSDTYRPVLVIGVDGPDATHHELHDVQLTRAIYEQLTDEERRHFARARIVEALEPILQKHQIAGLV